MRLQVPEASMTMQASMAITTIPHYPKTSKVRSTIVSTPSTAMGSLFPCKSFEVANSNGLITRRFKMIISASNSGLEASVSDPEDSAVTLKNAKIIVESQDQSTMQLRVDLSGDETLRVFDQVVTNLARTAPPIPGFRRQKGGKTSKVPKNFLVQMLGEERVTKFVIQEIINSSMADYVKKENLNVKGNKISTTQTTAELQQLFTPGNGFGFNVTLELENLENPSS